MPLGLYLHIPFCRKRCQFCYFRVYTDKNAQEVEALPRRAGARVGALRASCRRSPAGRSTSSTSAAARRRSSRRSSSSGLVDAAQRGHAVERGRGSHLRVRAGHADREPSWRRSASIGVTRLSLGVENFDDDILELNGRAHRSPEIYRAYGCARALGFPQINIDLIAGMLGETEENWRDCVEKTLELEPDSVTIYQMELPFNTTISSDLLKGTGQFARAGRRTGRPSGAGSSEAFDALERAGYHVRQRLHRGEGPGADAVRLPRPPLAGRRHGRPRRRLVRPRQRRPHAEPRHVGDLQRRDRARRDPAQPRLPADRRGAADSRAGAAAQARLDPAGVLRRQVQREHPRPFQRAVRVAGGRGLSATGATRTGVALARTGCCASTRCCRASSCPSTPASATRRDGRVDGAPIVVQCRSGRRGREDAAADPLDAS